MSTSINLARGLQSLVDQAVEKLTNRAPHTATMTRGLGDVLKQAIQENSSIPQQDFTAVDLARRAGLLPPAQKGPRRR